MEHFQELNLNPQPTNVLIDLSFIITNYSSYRCEYFERLSVDKSHVCMLRLPAAHWLKSSGGYASH